MPSLEYSFTNPRLLVVYQQRAPKQAPRFVTPRPQSQLMRFTRPNSVTPSSFESTQPIQRTPPPMSSFQSISIQRTPPPVTLISLDNITQTNDVPVITKPNQKIMDVVKELAKERENMDHCTNK